MIPSAVHPQDLSRDLLTERSWGTSREGGITDDIKAETERGPRAFPSAHSTLSPAGFLGDACAPNRGGRVRSDASGTHVCLRRQSTRPWGIRTCVVAFLSSRETYEHVTVLHLVGVIHSLPVGTLSGNLRPIA